MNQRPKAKDVLLRACKHWCQPAPPYLGLDVVVHVQVDIVVNHCDNDNADRIHQHRGSKRQSRKQSEEGGAGREAEEEEVAAIMKARKQSRKYAPFAMLVMRPWFAGMPICSAL